MTSKRIIVTRNNAKLKSNQEPEDNEIFNSLLRGIPVNARDAFKMLKKEGKVTGSMNAFIINAFIEKLDSMK
jgi:hypothetical protein